MKTKKKSKIINEAKKTTRIKNLDLRVDYIPVTLKILKSNFLKKDTQNL